MSQPHDRFVRHAFSYHDLAVELFRLFQSEREEDIDLGDLIAEPGSEVSWVTSEVWTC